MRTVGFKALTAVRGLTLTGGTPRLGGAYGARSLRFLLRYASAPFGAPLPPSLSAGQKVASQIIVMGITFS